VRRLYERAVSLKFSSKKKKTLFKMYLAFEREHGSARNVEHVQQLIRSYVNEKDESE
jgi:rRNA biogenesis protein RRP5